MMPVEAHIGDGRMDDAITDYLISISDALLFSGHVHIIKRTVNLIDTLCLIQAHRGDDRTR